MRMIDSKSILLPKYTQTFYKDVTRLKQFAAKIWSCMFTSILIVVCYLWTNLYPTGLFDLISSSFSLFFTLRLWLYLPIILTLFWLKFTFNNNLYKISQKVYQNNIDQTLDILYSIGFLYFIQNTAALLFIGSFLLNLFDASRDAWFDGKSLFVLLFTCFSSVFTRFQFLLQSKNILSWPMVKQSRFFRFKSKFYKTFIETTNKIIYHLVLWIVLHKIFTSLLPFNGISISLFDISTISAAFKLAFIVNLSNEISWILQEIYLTEIHHFDIEQVDKNLSLSGAISHVDNQYVQMLGLLDLVFLSNYSESRRKRLFTLNNSINQATSWLNIYEATQSILKTFIDAFNFDNFIHGSSTSQMDTLENLLLSPQLSKKALKNPKWTDTLKQNKFFSKFYRENSNYKSQQLFTDTILVINAIKALSNLTASSFKEDQYGIVQNNLPEILTTFIQIQKILEKFNYSSINFKLLQKSDSNQMDFLIQKLITTLNESIYKITLTFGSSLK